MASIKKRGATYRVQIRRKGYPAESATFGVRAQAVQWAARREAELVGARHGILPTRSVRQALERYRDEISPGHRGGRWEVARIGKFLGKPDKRFPERVKVPSIPFLDRDLAGVAPHDLAAWRDTGLRVLAPGSVRREFGLLRSVFALAVREWGWLRESPFARLSAPPDGAARTRRVADAETDAIIAALGYARGTRPATASQFIAAAFLFALETMMRQGEVLALVRSDVHADYVHVRKSKNGEARDVPLAPEAAKLLELLPEEGALFPVSSATCDTLFRRAREAAGIEGLHFHDSRREATTRLSKKLDVLTLAKAGGWRDVNMLLRVYYAPSVSDAAQRLR